MIAIIDYGVGNLFSLRCSFGAIGAEAEVTADEKVISSADGILLPGVGAFADAAEKLRRSGMDRVIKEQVKRGKPLLGICLGMQLLFDRSYEYGEHEGLGLIKGNIRPLSDVLPAGVKIPQMGWNSLSFVGEKNTLFRYLNEGAHVYFVHSYYAADCDENVTAVTDYYAKVTAAAAKDNIYGCQFHPEKSGKTGLNVLRAFCEIAEEKR